MFKQTLFIMRVILLNVKNCNLLLIEWLVKGLDFRHSGFPADFLTY